VERSSAAKASPVPVLRYRCEKIVLFGTERSIRGGSGSHNTRHLSPHKFLGELGVLHLLADRNPEALAHQLRNVTIGRVVRDSTHGHGQPLFFVARRESDLKFAGCEDRVIEKKFVEVTEAKK
jgi:hypothetical protein